MSEKDGEKRKRTGRQRPRLDAGLLRSLGVDQLVPASLAVWRPLVSDGLGFFLEGLPEARQLAIVAEQLALPADSSSGRRLTALFAQSPTLHKLGQVIARQRALPLAVRRPLQSLESMPATTPISDLRAIIHAEIGAPPVTLAGQALAEGSVAVVVPFTWRELGQRPDDLRHGVFKILKPGVETRLAEELAVLAELEPFLVERGRNLGLPELDYGETLGSVRRLLTREVNFANEQHNLRAAAAFYAAEPRVLVPRLLPWCTPRLTAMERVFGEKITDAVTDAVTDVTRSPLGRRAPADTLADTLVAALLAQPFWSQAEPAVFHADLHAGNLLLAEDGRLAILDWSLTARLTQSQRQALVAVALGGLTLDSARIRAAIAELGGLNPADAALGAAVEQALDRLLAAGGFPGFDWLLGLLDAVALRTATRFPEDLLLFRKSWLALAGVIDELAEDNSPDRELLSLGLQRFLEEMPARLGAAPDRADFSTHVSNADLWRLCASPGLVATRYWLRQWARLGG